MNLNNLTQTNCPFDEDRILTTNTGTLNTFDVLIDQEGNVLVTEC